MILLSTGLMNAQIKVVEKIKTNEIGRISQLNDVQVKITEQDNNYTLTYLDTTIKTVNVFRSFTFKDQNNDIEALYKMVTTGLETLPEDPIELELPKDIVHLEFMKILGLPNVRFTSYKKDTPQVKGESIWLTKKKVDILFNRFNKTP